MCRKLIYCFLIFVFIVSCQSKSVRRKVIDERTITTINVIKQNNENSATNSTKEYAIGKVVAIIDGDTYDLLVNGNQTVRIRMEGIDAPERGMPYYQVAKKHLSDLCFSKLVKFIPTKEPDSHNRLIGFTYLDNGVELSHEMLKAGLAWHFKKYNSDQDLSELEIKARNSRIGLWQNENPMPPWNNRKLHRQGISTKNMY